MNYLINSYSVRARQNKTSSLGQRIDCVFSKHQHGCAGPALDRRVLDGFHRDSIVLPTRRAVPRDVPASIDAGAHALHRPRERAAGAPTSARPMLHMCALATSPSRLKSPLVAAFCSYLLHTIAQPTCAFTMLALMMITLADQGIDSVRVDVLNGVHRDVDKAGAMVNGQHTILSKYSFRSVIELNLKLYIASESTGRWYFRFKPFLQRATCFSLVTRQHAYTLELTYSLMSVVPFGENDKKLQADGVSSKRIL